MGKSFRNIFLVLLLLNFLIKAIIYFSSNKVNGIVTGLRESYTIEHKINRTVKQKVVVPEIEYNIEGKTYLASERYWGYVGNYKINEIYELIYNENPEKVDLNGFFQFWLRVIDVGIMFGITVIFTIILETVGTYKKKS